MIMDYEKKYKESMAKMSTFLAKHDGFTISKDGEMYKELSEIFPELKESDGKDEKIRKALIRAFKSLDTIKVWNGIERTDIIAWLEKQGEQKPAEEYNITGIGSKNAQGKLGEMIKNLKPVNEVLEQNHAWSEEDEKQARQIERIVHDGCTQKLQKQIADWFKSIKGRVPPKQEWSEEDEYCRHQLMVFCENCMVQDAGAKRCAHWLNSLRPQNHWKPSDEQIKAVKEAACYSSVFSEKTIDNLISLSKDLKKLKG